MSFVPSVFTGADEMFVRWSPAGDPLPSELWDPAGDGEPARSLQDFFAFGDLGLPPGVPGSFPLAAADQAALDSAARESESSPLGRSDGFESALVR